MASVQTATGFRFNVDEAQLAQFNHLMKSVSDLHAFQKLRNHQLLDVISTCRPLFYVDFPHSRTVAEWLIYHLQDEGLGEVQVMLIEDTVRYLKDGYRRIPLAMYEQLFDSAQGRSLDSISSTVTLNKESRIHRRKVVQELIQVIRELDVGEPLFYRWVRTKVGVMDLIHFMKLLLVNRKTVLKL